MPGPACLVTGASGFLGRHVLHALLHAGAEVTALSRTAVDQYRTVIADLRTPELTIPGTFDVVYHAAGHAHTIPRTSAETKRFFDINVDGLRHVLAALEGARRLP